MKKIDIKWKAEQMTSQKGKTAIVTGSNTGIGYHMALALADKGALVVLACRNLDKAGKARAKMIAGRPDSRLAMPVGRHALALCRGVLGPLEAYSASGSLMDGGGMPGNAGV